MNWVTVHRSNGVTEAEILKNMLESFGIPVIQSGTVVSKGTVLTSNNTALGTGPVTLGDAGTGSSNVSWLFAGSGTPANPVIYKRQVLIGHRRQVRRAAEVSKRRLFQRFDLVQEFSHKSSSTAQRRPPASRTAVRACRDIRASSRPAQWRTGFRRGPHRVD